MVRSKSRKRLPRALLRALGRRAKKSQAKHVVILLHGIRTFGDWQARLALLLGKRKSQIEIVEYRYGYFTAPAFLLPPLRRYPINSFLRSLRRNSARWADARVDIVAHSFGTYIAARALQSLARGQELQVNTVLLSGCILKQGFDWEAIVGKKKDGKIVSRVINDCGTKDIWPLMAQLFVLGMGLAGRHGFSGPIGASGIINRYFKFGHSGFFAASKDFQADHEEFFRRMWLPVLLKDRIAPGIERVPPKAKILSGLETVLEPLKLAGLVLPVLALSSILLKLSSDRHLERVLRAVNEVRSPLTRSLLLAELEERRPSTAAVPALRAVLNQPSPEAAFRTGDRVTSARIAPDGESAAIVASRCFSDSGCESRLDRWKLDASERSKISDTDRVEVRAISADGQYLLYEGKGSPVSPGSYSVLCNYREGECSLVQTQETREGWIDYIEHPSPVFSPDSEWLLGSCGVRWRLPGLEREDLVDPSLLEQPELSCWRDPQGERLLTWSPGRAARLWQTEDPGPGRVIQGTTGLAGAAFAPGDDLLVTLTTGGELSAWDLATVSRVGRVDVGALPEAGGTDELEGDPPVLLLSGDGSHLFVRTGPATVEVFDGLEAKRMRKIANVSVGGSCEYRAFESSFDGSRLAVEASCGRATCRIERWQLSHDPSLDGAVDYSSETVLEGSCDRGAPFKDASFYAEEVPDGVVLYELARNGGRFDLVHPGRGPFDFHPHAAAVITGAWDGTVLVWRLDQASGPGEVPARSEGVPFDYELGRRSAEQLWEGQPGLNPACSYSTSDAFEVSDALGAYAYSDGTVVSVCRLDGSLWRQLDRGGVADLAFNPVEPEMAIVSHDGALALWDLEANTTRSLSSDALSGFPLAYSGDGSRLAFARERRRRARASRQEPTRRADGASTELDRVVGLMRRLRRRGPLVLDLVVSGPSRRGVKKVAKVKLESRRPWRSLAFSRGGSRIKATWPYGEDLEWQISGDEVPDVGDGFVETRRRMSAEQLWMLPGTTWKQLRRWITDRRNPIRALLASPVPGVVTPVPVWTPPVKDPLCYPESPYGGHLAVGLGGKLYAIGSGTGVTVCSENGVLLHDLPHSENLLDYMFRPHRSELAVALDNGEIVLWDLGNRRLGELASPSTNAEMEEKVDLGRRLVKDALLGGPIGFTPDGGQLLYARRRVRYPLESALRRWTYFGEMEFVAREVEGQGREVAFPAVDADTAKWNGLAATKDNSHVGVRWQDGTETVWRSGWVELRGILREGPRACLTKEERRRHLDEGEWIADRRARRCSREKGLAASN